MGKPSKENEKLLSGEIVRDLFVYDEDTGSLIWRKRVSPRIGAGHMAGYVAADGYQKVFVFGRPFLAHRIIWLYHYNEWPKKYIDHIDGNRLNNKISNLRDVSGMENQRNRALAKNNKSGIAGVCWSRHYKRWVSRIKINNKFISLGSYEDFFEACCARKSAEKHFGFHENHGRVQNE